MILELAQATTNVNLNGADLKRYTLSVVETADNFFPVGHLVVYDLGGLLLGKPLAEGTVLYEGAPVRITIGDNEYNYVVHKFALPESQGRDAPSGELSLTLIAPEFQNNVEEIRAVRGSAVQAVKQVLSGLVGEGERGVLLSPNLLSTAGPWYQPRENSVRTAEMLFSRMSGDGSPTMWWLGWDGRVYGASYQDLINKVAIPGMTSRTHPTLDLVYTSDAMDAPDWTPQSVRRGWPMSQMSFESSGLDQKRKASYAEYSWITPPGGPSRDSLKLKSGVYKDFGGNIASTETAGKAPVNPVLPGNNMIWAFSDAEARSLLAYQNKQAWLDNQIVLVGRYTPGVRAGSTQNLWCKRGSDDEGPAGYDHRLSGRYLCHRVEHIVDTQRGKVMTRIVLGRAVREGV